MSLLQDLYHKTLAENEKNIRFWEDYLQNLTSLDFNCFSDNLKVPVLVPVGSKILFRGELKHTNEITVALGADYFAKCSVKQAEVLRQHRIKGAKSKLETFRKEKEYLENQLLFSKDSVFANTGKEITEVHNDEEEKTWRKKHRENVRRWKQKGDNIEIVEDKTDEELWERLEELELQEELENELAKDSADSKSNVDCSFVVREETTFQDSLQDKELEGTANAIDKQVMFSEDNIKPTGTFELLQKVIDKQNELEEKLMELRFKDRSKSKTQEDLIAKLDEMDELEELQDEMDSIEDLIETEDKASSNSDNESPSITKQGNVKRRVSFAADDEPETMELSFHHTDIVPCIDPYNPAKGITKPSDVYEAYSNLFNSASSSSILKRTKREDRSSKIVMPEVNKTEITILEPSQPEVKTIVVKDVVEKVEDNKYKLESDKRPVSLFKQRRQQKK